MRHHVEQHGPHDRECRPRDVGRFEQPHRKPRDYVAFGPFQFGRHPYDDALRPLSEVISSDVDDPRA